MSNIIHYYHVDITIRPIQHDGATVCRLGYVLLFRNEYDDWQFLDEFFFLFWKTILG